MPNPRMHDHEEHLDADLARRLVAGQFPQLAGLDLVEVTPWGTDNAIWRLGDDWVVRLPRIASANGQPGFEHQWLPRLAHYLSVALPEPVGLGEPTAEYPFAWSVHRWLPGQPAGPESIADPIDFAGQIRNVISELLAIPNDGAPAPINRARSLHEYDDATRRAIDACRRLIDTETALAIWQRGLDAEPHSGAPVWVHGDLEGNCLVQAGRLSGIVDWGCACAGDPAVDVQVAWSPLFTPESRAFLLAELQVDQATIDRARAMAINQACGALPYYLDTYPLIVERSWHKLHELGVRRLDS